MKHLTFKESWRDQPEFVELARPIAEAQTIEQVKEAVSKVRETIESKYPDKIQEEDIQIFIKYCDSILKEGMNDHQAFIAEMRRVWGILTNG